MNVVGQIEVLTVLYKINVFLIDNGKSSCHNRQPTACAPCNRRQIQRWEIRQSRFKGKHIKFTVDLITLSNYKYNTYIPIPLESNPLAGYSFLLRGIESNSYKNIRSKCHSWIMNNDCQEILITFKKSIRTFLFTKTKERGYWAIGYAILR